jgi:hypothetical protein
MPKDSARKKKIEIELRRKVKIFMVPLTVGYLYDCRLIGDNQKTQERHKYMKRKKEEEKLKKEFWKRKNKKRKSYVEKQTDDAI